MRTIDNRDLRSCLHLAPVRRGGALLIGQLAPSVELNGRPLDLVPFDMRRAEFKQRPRLVGIIIGRPHSALVKDVIIPNWNDWHERSGEHLDVLCVGFEPEKKLQAPYFESLVEWSKAVEQALQASQFEAIVQWLESRFSWKRSGDTDLILANAVVSPTGRLLLDTKNSVVLSIESAIAAGAIETLPSFMESIFRFAREYEGTDPSWGFSDEYGLRKLKSGPWHILVSLFPKALRKEAEQAKFFYVKDLRRRKEMNPKPPRAFASPAPST